MAAMAPLERGVVIVGGGHAGYQCVESLRRGGYAGRLTLVDADGQLPYHKPPLSKDYLQHDADPARLHFRPAAFYDQEAVDLRLGRRAVAIERRGRSVVLDDGESLRYDQLVLATGSRARPLSVSRERVADVHVIKTIADIDRIRARLQSVHDVTVVGSGFTAMEFAATATLLGKSVRVLARGQRVLAQALPACLSAWLLEEHRRRGVQVLFGRTVERVELDESDTTGGLRVTDSSGAAHRTGLLVAAIGAEPETGLAAAAGLECEDGIVVDAYCRTSDPAIYAAGDAVRFFHPLLQRQLRLESVQNALGQAKTIAAHLLGRSEVYDAVPWFWSDQYDLKLQMAGLHEGFDRLVWRGDPASRRFSVLLYRKSRLIAVHSVNRPGDHMAARKLLAAGVSPPAEQAGDERYRLADALAA